MKEGLVQTFEGGILVKAKVPRLSNEREARIALLANGKSHDSNFRLTEGPIGSLKFGVAQMEIPQDLKEVGDSENCLVLGIGEVLPPTI